MAFLNLSDCGTNPEHFRDQDEDLNIWYSEIKEVLKYQDEKELTKPAMFNKPSVKKEQLAKWLSSIAGFLIFQKELVQGMRDDVGVLKTHLIESQSTVIKLQGELLECKKNQLQSVQSAVKESVQDTVSAEMKSYSQAVAENAQNTAFTQANLKKVLKDVVKEEDRSRNVMLFGMGEEGDEQLNIRVGEVFQELGVKPRVEACRVGRVPAGKGKARPVKISLASSSIVNQILINAKNLKDSQRFKTVYISPDRSVEQRAQHKKLVEKLREKYTTDPNNKHFIMNGKICSAAKDSV